MTHQLPNARSTKLGTQEAQNRTTLLPLSCQVSEHADPGCCTAGRGPIAQKGSDTQHNRGTIGINIGSLSEATLAAPPRPSCRSPVQFNTVNLKVSTPECNSLLPTGCTRQRLATRRAGSEQLLDEVTGDPVSYGGAGTVPLSDQLPSLLGVGTMTACAPA